MEPQQQSHHQECRRLEFFILVPILHLALFLAHYVCNFPPIRKDLRLTIPVEAPPADNKQRAWLCPRG